MIQKTKRSIQWVIENKTIFLPKKKKYAGIHFIAEFWNGKIIEDIKEVKRIYGIVKYLLLRNIYCIYKEFLSIG